MERLTKWEKGIAVAVHGEDPGVLATHARVQAIITRLARYEDSEMNPEEIKKKESAQWADRYHDGDLYCNKCGAIVEKDEQGRHFYAYCYHCGRRMTNVSEWGEYRER